MNVINILNQILEVLQSLYDAYKLDRPQQKALPAAKDEYITRKVASEEVLFCSRRTFYRLYERYKWPRRFSGNKWLYLKSAMLESREADANPCQFKK
ncbi:hypothetical protein [Pedobacter sp. JY14-1]|uniref:hypothetical protein n=1 Tax=Pedobacter sp. JY14-1 TaxID=3034151 RepID=UPI0023E1399F|nr:hypothetical protein [Pedobacter sp. JY14-1]